MRSRTLDDFLGITDRIKTIRSLLGPDMSLLSSHSHSHSPHQSPSQHHTQSQPFTQQHSHIQSQQHTQPHTQSAPSSSHVPVSYGIGSRSRVGNGNELPGVGDDASVSVSQNETTLNLNWLLLTHSLLTTATLFLFLLFPIYLQPS